MVLIVCVDESNGMLFNKRRQSRDRILMEHICSLIGDMKVWTNSFSKELFANLKCNVIVDDEFTSEIDENDFCFVENISPVSMKNKIDKIILYNWNRKYPADMYFDISLDDWVLESELEFAGSSHEKITQKIYRKGEK